MEAGVLIVGAGPVGLTLAIDLACGGQAKDSRPQQRVRALIAAHEAAQ
jgi:2-polyprenyl-6-methoxyphenol hydroxylase-like FAD-dependent oxidoreductase